MAHVHASARLRRSTPALAETALPPHSGAHPCAERHHAVGALRRPDRDPHGVRKPLCAGAGRDLLAAFLDGIDGRLARFLKGTSRFGAELDSLADFVNFGGVL